ncbi:MAG: hypothetical protein MK135_11310, partial [Polyangiaceae bacterium]|nr:hypothetical protein [Polyangiaceae bacterium]
IAEKELVTLPISAEVRLCSSSEGSCHHAISCQTKWSAQLSIPRHPDPPALFPMLQLALKAERPCRLGIDLMPFIAEFAERRVEEGNQRLARQVAMMEEELLSSLQELLPQHRRGLAWKANSITISPLHRQNQTFSLAFYLRGHLRLERPSSQQGNSTESDHDRPANQFFFNKIVSSQEQATASQESYLYLPSFLPKQKLQQNLEQAIALHSPDIQISNFSLEKEGGLFLASHRKPPCASAWVEMRLEYAPGRQALVPEFIVFDSGRSHEARAIERHLRSTAAQLIFPVHLDEQLNRLNPPPRKGLDAWDALAHHAKLQFSSAGIQVEIAVTSDFYFDVGALLSRDVGIESILIP